MEVDVVQESEASPVTSGSVRERILEFVKGQIPAGEHEALVTGKMIAEAVGVNPNNVAYHLAKMVAMGEISTRGSGRQGTRIRLGGTPQQRRGRGARRVAAEPVARAAAKSGLNFCPYCGGKVLAEDWRFCGTCGKPLQ